MLALNLFTRSSILDLSAVSGLKIHPARRGPVQRVRWALKRRFPHREPAQRSGIGNHARYLLVVAV